MSQSEETTPEPTEINSSPELRPEESADRLRKTVARLANQVRPFPAFHGMSTLQAIELELPPDLEFQQSLDLGCVVLLPNGEISELDLRMIPGAVGPAEVDQVEQFRELDLPAEQYIAYATLAVQLLLIEIARQTGPTR